MIYANKSHIELYNTHSKKRINFKQSTYNGHMNDVLNNLTKMIEIIKEKEEKDNK